MDFGNLAGWFLVQLPFVAVGLVGLVLAATQRRRLRGRTAGLAMAGCVVILLGVVAFMGWIASFELIWLVEPGTDWEEFLLEHFDLINKGLGFMVSIVQACGFGLLVGAALASRVRGPAPGGPYSSPSGDQ
jgi:hypothetical protein